MQNSWNLVTATELSMQTGVSRWTWRDWRLDGRLKPRLHYAKLNSRKTLYNVELIKHGLLHGFDSPEHRIACEKFLASLASNQPKRK
jgi:hypothetical protein